MNRVRSLTAPADLEIEGHTDATGAAGVELVREGPMSQPFDLDVVAQRFTQNLRSWDRDAVVER